MARGSRAPPGRLGDAGTRVLVKKGERKCGEFTDAAGGVRAECIMLNKGLHVVQGVRELQGIIGRMSAHFDKKRPQLRPLTIARPAGH